MVSASDISDNAIKVLRRLNQSGYQAYLVGGSVRDLLRRKAPKDFDIATNAKPEQIRKLFRNCRLIGRRFRLAHIHFGREIIEVATFRCEGTTDSEHRQIDHDGMILRDNVYGSMQDDAARRDFTINALYYDSSNYTIVDYVGGYEDIQQGLLRIIGDATTRYCEDPVRMLRAIRFQSKMDFELEAKTAAPIKSLAPRIQSVPAARLFEETLKMFQHGHSYKNFIALEKHGLFSQLFPLVAQHLDTEAAKPYRQLIIETLKNTDTRIANSRPVTPAFLFAAILWHPLLKYIETLREEGMEPLPALEKAMDKVIQQQNKATAIPKRFVNVIREIWLLQYRLPKRYGRRAYRMLEHPRFRAGYDFLLLRASVGDESQELAEWWTEFQSADDNTRASMVKSKSRRKKPKPRRKKPNVNH